MNYFKISYGTPTVWTLATRGRILTKYFPSASQRSKMIVAKVRMFNFISTYTQLALSLRLVAACHLRTLGNLIATNSEVRKILSDFSVIGRDVLARTASQAAETIRPNQDALAKVDQSAPSDQFETAGGSQVGSSETPVPELGVPGSNTAIRHHPVQGAEIEHDDQVRSASRAADETRERVAAEAKNTLEYVFLADLLRYGFDRFDREASNGNADADTKKSGLAGRFQNLKVSVRTDKNSPVIPNSSVRMVCPTVILKSIRTLCAIGSNKVAKFSQRNISLRIDATNLFTASRR
jgi:Family of unknown function (DUF5923)